MSSASAHSCNRKVGPVDQQGRPQDQWSADRLLQHLCVMQEYRPLVDWKVVAAAPLVIENQLPVRGTYLIWETPRVCIK